MDMTRAEAYFRLGRPQAVFLSLLLAPTWVRGLPFVEECVEIYGMSPQFQSVLLVPGDIIRVRLEPPMFSIESQPVVAKCA